MLWVNGPFESLLTPALALERLVNIAEYPHSEVQHISLSFEQWTSCRKNIAYFLVFSHRNISRLSMGLDSPLAFKEQITNSLAKAFGQVKGVRNRK